MLVFNGLLVKKTTHQKSLTPKTAMCSPLPQRRKDSDELCKHYAYAFKAKLEAFVAWRTAARLLLWAHAYPPWCVPYIHPRRAMRAAHPSSVYCSKQRMRTVGVLFMAPNRFAQLRTEAAPTSHQIRISPEKSEFDAKGIRI